MKLAEIRDTGKKSLQEWKEDKASRLAAALSFYTLFAVAPLLLVFIAILGLVLGRAAVQGSLMSQIGTATGPQAAGALQSMLANTQREPSSNIIALVIAGLFALVTATGLLLQVQDALNTVWHVQPKKDQGLRGMLRSRVVSLLMLAATAVILLVSVIVGPAVTAFARLIPILGHNTAVLQLIELAFFWSVITVLFAAVYKILPDVETQWRDVWAGAAVTALLFVIGKFLLSLYFGLTHLSSTYGAASGLVVILLWVYYSAQIFLLGAEFTKVRAMARGDQLKPKDYAGRAIPEGHGPGPERQQEAA